jgi:ATP-dependent Clp protease ATP-binding subunit ClpC
MSEPISLIFCEQCRGTGKISEKRCDACGGKSVGGSAHGLFLYWDFPVTGYDIAYRHVKLKFDTAINLLLVIVGLALLGYFTFDVSQSDSILNIATLDFWMYPSPSCLIFVAGLAVFLFILMRLVRLAPILNDVPQRAFISDEAEDAARIQMSWAEIRRLPTKDQLNISTTFTHDAQAVIENAYRIASANNSAAVTNAHVFAALLKNDHIQTLFIRLLISTDEIEKKIEAMITGAGIQGAPMISHEAWQVMFDAYTVAWSLREPRVDVTELLQAVVAADEPLRDILSDFEIKQEALLNVIQWVRVRQQLRRKSNGRVRGGRGRSKGDTNRSMTAIATPFLNSFSEDLTRASLWGALEPMVGREHEIEEIFRVMQGGGTSVLLVGEHGVGKKSIVHGIADLMVSENVPDVLKDKRLVELNVSRMLSGVGPSEAEERLLTMLNELEHAGNIILVIPSVEKLVGITIGQQQSMDVASVLTQELGKHQFLTIATTTSEAFNRVIANQSIGTVFQKIVVEEMTTNDAVQVLEAKVGYMEYKHDVWFSYVALERAVTMSQRYLHDAFLPQKAIEICNEVALYVRNKRGKSALVLADDVAAIIAQKTKIPVTAVTEDEGEKLMRLESEMHQRVIGQEEAVTLVANALRRSRAEIRTGKRPIANFLFLGPTGVGKTELTKTIAEVYFGSENQMVRMDMSEYQDTNSIYRMIGTPGQQGTGVLTEAVRQKPFSLVLLDEIEKADPNILNLFLQVMDDGRLTDSVGRVIDFTSSIVIATSNAGTQFVQDQMRAGVSQEQIKTQLIHGELKQYFKPEFLNRFDAIVLFHPLTQDQIGSVARLILRGIGKKLEERGIVLEVTDGGVAMLAAAGFDPEFGARPLRRVIQDRVENAIAGLLLQNQVHRKDTIVVDENGVHVRNV